MKVLLLPYNIANFLTIGLQALEKEPDLEVRALVLADRSPLHDYDGVKVIPWLREKRMSLKWLLNIFSRYYYFLKWVLWADVIHWCWDDKVLTKGLALKIVKWLKKPALIEFLGSEVRIFKEEFVGNPQCREHYQEIYGASQEELDNRSLTLQKKFSNAGFCSISCPEISFFVKEDWFRLNFDLFQRIPASDFRPHYPVIDKKKALVVHAPSKPIVKGSESIEITIAEILADGEIEFDFELITGKKHTEAIAKIAECDVYIDHMGNAGSGYGMAALEAMSFGKPVITFIRPKLLKKLPKDLPIVVSGPDNLKEQLSLLLKDPSRRNKLGRMSRAYVEKYHDTEKLVPRLKVIYSQVIESNLNRG